MRGPKASVGSQGGDIRQWMGSGGGTAGGEASSSAGAPALRQADLTQLAGVVMWDGGSSLLEGIPSTLYLGEHDVTQLKERLQDASTRECPEDQLVLLRRLSSMVTSAPPARLPGRRGPPSVVCAERASPPASPAAVHASTPGGDPDWRDCREAQEINRPAGLPRMPLLPASNAPVVSRCAASASHRPPGPHTEGCSPACSGGGAGVPYRACVERAAGRAPRPDGRPQAAIARRRRRSPPPVRPREIAAAAAVGLLAEHWAPLPGHLSVH